jgi:hypothetical protein
LPGKGRNVFGAGNAEKVELRSGVSHVGDRCDHLDKVSRSKGDKAADCNPLIALCLLDALRYPNGM